MDVFSLWHKEPQVSFAHVLFTQMDEQINDLLQHANPRISAQLKNTLRSRQSLHWPPGKAKILDYWRSVATCHVPFNSSARRLLDMEVPNVCVLRALWNVFRVDIKVLSISKQSRGHSLNVRTEQSPLKGRGCLYLCAEEKKRRCYAKTICLCNSGLEANAVWGTQVELFSIIHVFSKYYVSCFLIYVFKCLFNQKTIYLHSLKVSWEWFLHIF